MTTPDDFVPVCKSCDHPGDWWGECEGCRHIAEIKTLRARVVELEQQLRTAVDPHGGS